MKDVVERYHIRKGAQLSEVVDVLASSIGSPTNPLNIENTFKTKKREVLKSKTISSYITKLKESFLLDEARRYNVKGRKYIASLSKYYFADIGLRNARLGFRQIEETHLMENAIFNELKMRGFEVDVGIVEVYGKNEKGSGVRKSLEIDFVANKGRERYYIQSAMHIDDAEKAAQEKRPFGQVGDAFKKVIIVKGKVPARIDENGYVTIGLIDFLLDPRIM